MKPLSLIFDNYNFLADIHLKTIFTFAKVNFKKEEKYFPCWSLDKVVEMFKSREFKCLCIQNIEYSLLKDFFLILMACPKRISEFQALTIPEIKFFKDGSVILAPHPKFIRKNENFHFKPKDFKIYPLNEDPEVCPVRALKHYIFNTRRLCKIHKVTRPVNLWINKKLKPASKANLRVWLRSIIFKADNSASTENTKFHSVRGLAASLLYKNYTIETVIKRMQWKSSNTFFKHYAKLGVWPRSLVSIAGLKVSNA